MAFNNVNWENFLKVTNPHFADLLYDRHRILHLMGGAGSGKSVFITQKIIFRCMWEGDHTFLCLRKVGTSVKNSIFQRLINTIYDLGISRLVTINKSDFTIFFTKTNSKIICIGLDDREKIKSFEGLTGIWMEEATEFDEEDYHQLNIRFRGYTKNYKQIMLSYNPVDEFHWLKLKFHDEEVEDCRIHKSTFRDNEFIDEEYKKVLLNLEKQNPTLFAIYALGEWATIKGLIFDQFETIDRFPRRLDWDYHGFGLDFGYAKPTAFIRTGVIGDELFLDQLIYEEKLTTPDLAFKIKQSDYGRADFFSLKPKHTVIWCDSADPGRTEELKTNYGLNTRLAIKEKGSVKAGIIYMQSKIIYVTKSSVDLMAERSVYKWKVNKSGVSTDEPVDYKNHALDAARYGCYSPFRLGKNPISAPLPEKDQLSSSDRMKQALFGDVYS